ncbi:MAG TPA: hypothetical protein VFE47_01615, partial [Tepidisphaeraceae bacterium]|nr:hypothetical protein [Tepidisphaeraceae bacterium]
WVRGSIFHLNKFRYKKYLCASRRQKIESFQPPGRWAILRWTMGSSNAHLGKRSPSGVRSNTRIAHSVERKL